MTEANSSLARYRGRRDPEDDTALLMRNLYQETQKKLIAERTMIRRKSAMLLWSQRQKIRERAYQRSQSHADRLLAQKQLQLQYQAQEVLMEIHQEALDIILSVAREVVQAEIQTSRQSIDVRVREALKSLTLTHSPRVHVHPTLCGSNREESEIDFIENKDVPAGDAIIETVFGTIHLSWKSHFNTICTRLQTDLHESLE